VALANARGFWLAEQELSQAAWIEAMGGFFSDNNPSTHAGADLPVHGVLPAEADEFIAVANRRFERGGVAARARLPSSGEWLFTAATQSEGLAALERGAARPYNERELVQVAWTADDGAAPRATSASRPDRWGLVDLLGNVAEWCADAPAGAAQARGGAWNAPREHARADRVLKPAERQRDPGIGLRLVIEER
jgi:formylglycine-generating enzyme required for sulfatase activity